MTLARSALLYLSNARSIKRKESPVFVELTDVFRPWVLLALGLSLLPFAIALAGRLVRTRPSA